MTAYYLRVSNLTPRLQWEYHSLPIQSVQNINKRRYRWPLIRFVGTKHTGKRLFAVIGDPGKHAAVVVQKTGGETDASSGSDIRKGCVMIRTVEIPDLPGIDQSVLDSLQRAICLDPL